MPGLFGGPETEADPEEYPETPSGQVVFGGSTKRVMGLDSDWSKLAMLNRNNYTFSIAPQKHAGNTPYRLLDAWRGIAANTVPFIHVIRQEGRHNHGG